MLSRKLCRHDILHCIAATVFIFSTASVLADSNSQGCHAGSKSKIKNIIVLVPDGCNQAVQTLARWYKGSDLTVDKMTSGMSRTWSANSVITGSAAASTAFGTGFKTEEPFIGVGPSGSGLLSTYNPPLPMEYLKYRPLATVLEGAKSIGKATGLIATATISHATPGGQSAHVPDRNNEQEIAEQQVYQNIDVAFAGGKKGCWSAPTARTFATPLSHAGTNSSKTATRCSRSPPVKSGGSSATR